MADFSRQEFIQKLTSDVAFRSRIGITSSFVSLEELQAKAATAGYKFTLEEITAAVEAVSSNTLSDEDLEQVTGGAAQAALVPGNSKWTPIVLKRGITQD